MKLIPRYILRHFFPIFGLALFAFVGLYLIIDLFEKVGDIMEKEPSFFNTMLYFFYKSPFIIAQGIPMAVLLGTLITFGILQRNRELIAMRAAGVSTALYAVPIMIAASFLSIVGFGFGELVARPMNQQAQIIWDQEIRQHQPTFLWGRENVWYRGDDAIFQIRFYDKQQQTLQRVSLYYLNAEYELVQRVDCERIHWQDGHWVASNGVILSFTDQDCRQEVFTSKELQLSETPKDFATFESVPEDLSWFNLYRYVSKVRQEGYNSAPYEVELHLRLAFPLTALILSILGTTLALRQGIQGGIAIGVGTGLIVGSIYLAVLQIGSSLGTAGILPPAVGVWVANVIFLALAGYLWMTDIQ
jgi:lipopolysaccharide export system permease protein